MMRRFFQDACPLTRRVCTLLRPAAATAAAAAAPAFLHSAPREEAARFPSNLYNRVERIILVRHGQSLGNVDEGT